jgi:hypothetical protein
MKKVFFPAILVTAIAIFAVTGICSAAATISSSEYKAGDMVTIEGMIPPGQDLYIAVAQQKEFAAQDTNGAHEVKRLQKDMKKANFSADTKIPPMYYMITSNPNAFGMEGKKKFGGPSVLLGKGGGIYNTTMYYLKKKFAEVDPAAQAMLGPIQTEEQWNFLRYANESSYGINTIVKEGNNVGKVTIFSRTVITDHATSGKYWDKGTSIKLDKATGKFTATFKSYRHTAPDTGFDVYVNGEKSGSYNIAGKGFWLSKGYRYMNPLWITLGAILVGTYFSMIGAAGGMLMAAFQVLVVKTAGPVGINAANVLKPSNMALTYSPPGIVLSLCGCGAARRLADRSLIRSRHFHRFHLAGQVRLRCAAPQGLQGMAGRPGGAHGYPDPARIVTENDGKTQKHQSHGKKVQRCRGQGQSRWVFRGDGQNRTGQKQSGGLPLQVLG